MQKKSERKIIADTCVWIEFFRTRSEISNKMKELISDDLLAGTGIILSELLQGAKGAKEREVIIDIFNTMEYIEMTKTLWQNTGETAGALRTKGITLPLSDISIACCAQENGYKVFSIDSHFSEIPGLDLLIL